ncbi:MAG: energy-coupling factor transporter ATPase [Clostridia bacterium]|nr:energy-coupling factor transporter ATPase [Clostridia bacterium]
MSETVIKAENLSFSYKEDDGSSTEVLNGVNISIERGSFVAVLGHNGSGKSTFAKLCNLIIMPTDGTLSLFGKRIDEKTLTEDELFEIRRRVGMVFQNPDNQLVATIVEEDVAFGPENIGVPSNQIRKRVDDALALVGMSEFKKHSPHQLSGGQKQRVAIAGILALNPDIIILDEATAMLDPAGRREVLDTVHRLNREGKTILHITHYMEEAIDADRVIVINDGNVLIDGTPKEVFSHTELLSDAGLDVPQTTDLAHRLINDGYAIDGDLLDVEECAAEISSIIKGKAK